MNILIVVDQFNSGNNGTTISARRFAEGLKKAGHNVSIVCVGKTEGNIYGVKQIPLLPGISHIVHSQGMTFAMPDKKILREAISKADVVHFYMPFLLSMAGVKIVKELNVPHTAAYHVQPENITYTIGLGKCKKVNDGIYNFFNKHFFKYFTDIHCPSNFIANQLIEHGYTAKMHVISNGVEDIFKYHKSAKPAELSDKFVITMIGRYSNEKKQDILINAIKYSKYSDKIQLILAGKGLNKKKYMRLGKKLPNPPIMNFYYKDELLDLLSYSDLYVHSADAEIEAISCIEAFSCGLVPIIANSPKSATPQFALTDKSLFEPGNSLDLAKQIDYWIEHPVERKDMEIKYADSAENYRLSKSIEKIEEMFKDAISKGKSNG